MPRPVLRDGQESFSGGLNLVADESRLEPNEIRRADNARLTEFGGVKHRGGTQRLSASALSASNPVRGGHFWLRPGTTNQLLAVTNGTLYTGTYGIPMTWTSQAGSLASTVQPTFATFRGAGEDVVYIADGGALNKWNGTTLTTNIASTPNVSIIAVYNNRLYGCGDASNPYRLYWSALQDGDTLGIVASGGGYADIRTFAQSELTGLKALGAGLLIFHRNGISRFTGIGIDDIDIDAGTRGVSNDVGTYSPHAIVAVENVCLFLSDRGIFQVTEDGITAVGERPGGGVNSIGDRIESVLRTIDQSSLSRAVVGHNKLYHEVLFYLPDVGVYAFNYRLGVWSGPWTGIYTSTLTHSMWEALDASSAPIVLFGSADGFVRRVDTPSLYKDDYLSDGTGGVANTMTVQCHRMYCNAPTADKAYRWIFATFNPRGTTTGGISWQTTDTVGSQALPNAGGGSVWGAFNWGSGIWGFGTSIPARVQAHGSGTFIDVTITDDGATGALYSRIEVHAFLMGERY